MGLGLALLPWETTVNKFVWIIDRDLRAGSQVLVSDRWLHVRDHNDRRIYSAVFDEPVSAILRDINAALRDPDDRENLWGALMVEVGADRANHIMAALDAAETEEKP